MAVQEFCALLGISYPIIEGGLVYVGKAELAAAVSEAGGLGQVASGGITADELRGEIRRTKELTQKPFGVNLNLSHRAEEKLAVILEEKVPVVSLAAGNPGPFIPRLREAGVIAMALVGTPRHARKAYESGAQVVICEGYEAGGHNSPAELTTLALVPQVARAVPIPVVAAGGIGDGQGLVAALALGASGVQLGTRLVATQESPAHPRYKEALLQARGEDTEILERSLGGITRVLKGEYAARVLAAEKQENAEATKTLMVGEKNRLAALEGRLEEGYYYSGQAVGLIDSLPTVAEVFAAMLAEARTVRQNLPVL